VLSGRGLCDELITRPEEFYRLWCVVVCDLETSRIGAPYIYDISNLRVNRCKIKNWKARSKNRTEWRTELKSRRPAFDCSAVKVEEEDEEFQSFTVGVNPIDSILCCDTVKNHELMLQISMLNTHPHQ